MKQRQRTVKYDSINSSNFWKNKTVITSDSLETVLTLSNIKTIPSKLNEDSTYLLYEDKTHVFICSKKELTTFEKRELSC